MILATCQCQRIAHLVFKSRDASQSKDSETDFICPKFPKNDGIVFS